MSATNSDPTSATTTGTPMRARKKVSSTLPLISISGKNTTTVVSVAMVIANPTSPAPAMAASLAGSPLPRMR